MTKFDTTQGTITTARHGRTARRAALRLARTAVRDSEHHAGETVYVADGDGGATRIVHGPDGQHLSERRVPALGLSGGHHDLHRNH